MSYLVSVDRCPDRTEEEIRECEAELVENGQAVRCTECGELLTADDRGYEAYLCTKCAEKEALSILSNLRYIIKHFDTANPRAMLNDLRTILCFCDDYIDIFTAYLQDEEVNYEL